MSDYTATVYSLPNCGKCMATRIKIQKMGVPVTMENLREHPDKMDIMAQEEWLEAPLVEVHGSEGLVGRWAGLSMEDIDALQYVVGVSA